MNGCKIKTRVRVLNIGGLCEKGQGLGELRRAAVSVLGELPAPAPGPGRAAGRLSARPALARAKSSLLCHSRNLIFLLL